MAQQVVVIEPDYFSVEVTAPQTVTISNTGPQGATGPTGPEGGTSTLTTKGDLLGRSATAIARIPVGADGQMLTADSTNALGVAWTTPNPGDITAVNVTSPITGGGTSGSVTVGIDQTLLSITQSQVTNLTTDLAAKAPLASPALSGTPTAPTAAVDTNTTQVATTAFVVGQGYLKSATASSTYAPIASPTFTGTVTIPAGSSISGVAYLASANTFTAAPQQITINASGNRGFIVQAASGQTANLMEFRDSSNNLLSRFTNAGDLTFHSSGLVQARYYTNVGNTGAYLDYGLVSGTLSLAQRTAANVGFVIRAAASQTANLEEWQNSSGTVLSFVNKDGYHYLGTAASVGGTGLLGTPNFAVSIPGAAVVGQIVRGAASQTADLQQWQNSAGTNQAIMSSGGALRLAGRLSAGNTGIDYGLISGLIGSAGTIGLVIRAAASQTANLTEWQDSGATILARVASDGSFRAANLATTGTGTYIVDQNSGGTIRIAKSSTAASSPGTDQLRLYVLAGTNAGTLKLVVKAGTAGAETTILDNIPQT